MRSLLATLCFLSLLSAGCLSKTRKVTPPPATLLDASLDDLLAELRRLGSLQSMKATVDLQLSYLNDARTKETQLRDVRGFVLARRPDDIRVQAQVPVTGGRAFDMAANGSTFRVYLPWKGRFFEGDTKALRSEKRTENIRPQHVLEALLPEPPTEDELCVMDRVTEGPRHFYVVQMLVRRPGEGLRIRRKAWFDRTTLRMARMEVRNEEEEVISLARYRAWTDEFGEVFPREVVMTRPLEGYDLAVRFIKPGLNEEVPDDSFELEAPAGVEVERVGEEQDAAKTAAAVR